MLWLGSLPRCGDIQTVILCGGTGVRAMPSTLEVPKPLLLVGDRPGRPRDGDLCRPGLHRLRPGRRLQGRAGMEIRAVPACELARRSGRYGRGDLGTVGTDVQVWVVCARKVFRVAFLANTGWGYRKLPECWRGRSA